MATHFTGPLLGSIQSGGGVFQDLPLGAVDKVRSNYKVWVEDFSDEMADAELANRGVTLTDIGTATSPTEVVTAETRYLLLNPGTKADSGSEIQCIAVPSSNVQPPLKVPGLITSTTTLMDGLDMTWACRFGVMSDTTAWDGKVIMGWITTDTSMLSPTTGLPTVATGGGIGFHIGETGTLSYFGDQTAITTAAQLVDTGTSVLALTTAATFQWYEVGFRAHWIDASGGTGWIRYYLDGVELGVIATDLPMQSTQGYGVSFGIVNGPARDSDLAIDYIVTGITGPGR